MNSFFDTLRGLGPLRIGLMVGVAAAILAFFIYFTGRMTSPDMQLLYGDLDPAEGSKIVTELEAEGVQYQLAGGGTRILVPSEDVARVRMQMAGKGLPSGGSIGYEIFDQSEGLGSSSFLQNINHVRALEGELARTIRSIEGVHQARVHLVLPQRELFSRERNKPSASIVLTMQGARRLSSEQVAAIQQLVAAAVPEMQPDEVAVIDDQGNLLARNRFGDNAFSAGNAQEMRANMEGRLATQIEQLLERSVGVGNVRAEVSAELDFDRVTENSEIYDPDGQVVRSTQTVEENSKDNQGGEQAVTVNSNLPDANLPQLGSSGTASTTNRTEETVNYEISRTVKTHVRESGVVRRLTVAVLVNGTYAPDASGKMVYQPRSADELKKLAALAKNAAGIDTARGDTLEIANLQFASTSDAVGTPAPDGVLLGFDQRQIMRMAEMLVLGIVAVLVLLLVIRPLVGRMMERQMVVAGDMGGLLAGEAQGGAIAGPGGAGRPALTGPSGQPGLLSGPDSGRRGSTAIATQTGGGLPDEFGRLGEHDIEQMIDISKVEGRVRASSIRKISEIVEKHPEEAVSIVRNWLYQET
ncbi:flagellar M-ring protein FliF [Tistlia consotensis]|uniref:Flagellar M-ring protein n=1 Tax=Tistlia consotensis USBA 355 TaxID=560819 RepID=A0A1Y6CID8_9PROT|nr:flagellar basal-body MS-ring/collar protein FliF [Tistlia consotensis]SMF67650.1 flagellar M-ring protein FliF [Tistlia consotensis USBA 355]SNR99678.1 flagellar M-ring protein FliF [Tistlia consotensis]